MKIKVKILLGLLIIVIILGIGYFFVMPPRVVDTFPVDGIGDVELNSAITIKFDKPVKRQALEHFVVPEAQGEWQFKDPLIKNHLFRTLIFVPAVDFKPETEYQVQLKNITSPLGINLFSGEFSFKFKTRQALVEEEPKTQAQPQFSTTILDIPLDWQDYPLSCEAASLKMALNFKGVEVSEAQIMEKIGFDLTPRKNNIWGNPSQTYVGDIQGKICDTGYGVYGEPVAKAANNWREAEVFSKGNLRDLLKEIELGNPVMVWGTLPTETLHDCSWFTEEGKYVKAFKETHVRLAIGFIGTPESPLKIILNDPLAGRLYWSSSDFLTNWSVFDYSGVVVR